jgi:hypothetical protein
VRSGLPGSGLGEEETRVHVSAVTGALRDVGQRSVVQNARAQAASLGRVMLTSLARYYGGEAHDWKPELSTQEGDAEGPSIAELRFLKQGSV